MRPRYGLFALFALLPVSALAAGEVPEVLVEQARDCRDIGARAARLVCFDKVFGTPDAIVGQRLEVAVESPPEYWEQLMRQERSRDGDSQAFVLDKRVDGNGAPEQVLLTRSGRGEREAVLAISCQDRITRLEVAMPAPLQQGAVGLILVNDGERSAERWRVRNEGWLLQAGRGLPAIRTLRQWIDSDEVRLVSQEADLDGLVFELDGLEQALAPLRQACSW